MPAIVVHGDLAVFVRRFGVAEVVVAPGTMVASGLPKAGAAVCVVGDEASVMVAGCAYTTATHTIPGVGMLSIESLISSQQAEKLKSGGKPVILATGKFNAKFQVLVPAQQPAAPSPIPDATPSYSGQGEFESNNKRANGS
jgi:Contractile injection system spike tip protein